MANVHQFPKPHPKLQCSQCGVLIEAGCDCHANYVEVINTLREKDEARREYERRHKRNQREKAKQNQHPRPAGQDDGLPYPELTDDEIVAEFEGRPSGDRTNQPLTFDDLHEECEDCKDTEEQWQRSIDNFAGHCLSMRSLWKRLFGSWEEFKVPKSTLALAEQAAAEWAEVVRLLKSRK